MHVHGIPQLRVQEIDLLGVVVTVMVVVMVAMGMGLGHCFAAAATKYSICHP
jgi:hypothetical protein